MKNVNKTKKPKLSGFKYRLAKQKKELQEDVKKCFKLTNMFIKCGQIRLGAQEYSAVEAEVINSTFHNEVQNDTQREGFYFMFFKENSVDVLNDVHAENGAKKSMEVEKRNEPDQHHNYFIRPNENVLAAYLQYHPHQPQTNIPFSAAKAHTRKDVGNRIVSPQQREELKIQLDKLLDANIIRPIISKLAAPAFLVKKKEKGSYRLVVSYKELNDRVETDQYPLPRTTDLLRALEGSKYFSSIDLNSGFFQLPVKKDDQYKLAFTTCHGLFTFTRIPQGLKVSSSIFQRKLNEAFSELLYKSLIIYIDDLASYGKNFEQAISNLNQALLIMDKLNFSLKTSKCFFFNEKIELLGHIITRKGIKPMDKNTKAITEFKQPKTQKDVRSFIGMCSYYRKHVKDFAKIAHPLTELIKGDNKKIDWKIEHEESFQKLKIYLISEPLLKHFNDDKHVFLTDASIMGLGAYIEQPDDNNILHPIGYASRKLLDNEKTYSSTTLELLGLCFGITYFREYLWGRHFTVFCDNISLQYYKNLKIPSARIARLTLKLLDFDFNIVYKKGKENLIADALSRNAINKIDVIVEDEHTQINLNLDNIKNEQTKDKFCSDIIKAILEPNNKNIPKNIKRKTRRFILLNTILYYKKFTPPKNFIPTLVIPKSLINDILKSYHESPTGGHTG
ncbi:hypothetical protein QTP88_001702 [Uroleucon formosanum]